MDNNDIVSLLRKISAAYSILGENRFRIAAYDKAADSVEHLAKNIQDYWKDGSLNAIPGIGTTIAGHIAELLSTGRVKHWESVLAQVPEAVFPLLSVPGIGPKKAYTLVTELSLKHAKTAVRDLEQAAKEGVIADIEGFKEKSQDVILSAIASYKRGAIKENRMTLSAAYEIAGYIMAYISDGSPVERIDALGSLRRKAATIGDVDIAAATKYPKRVIDRFLSYPHQKVVDHGTEGATLLLANGTQVDLRVQKPDTYGAMLQYFTGSKSHNIALREYARTKGKSLSEHGIKSIKNGIVRKYATEEAFYKALGLQYIPPELREDRGEITAAKQGGSLPELVQIHDIRGDVHIHSDYDLDSSHDIGRSSIEDMLIKAIELGYAYVGFSDHNPSVATHTTKQIVQIMERRKEVYEHAYCSCNDDVKSRIHYFLMCEVDIQPDGSLALPHEAFEYIDAAVISIHSVFTQDRKTVTKRLVRALTAHPKVRILGHPTGRLLGKREGIDADWQEIANTAKQHDIAFEINANPQRLDLPDVLVYDLRKQGVRFCINSDAHEISHMELMPYGVSAARRGWAQKRDIVNTLGYTQFRKWLMKGV